MRALLLGRPCPHPTPTLRPLGHGISVLELSFLICTMERMIVLTSQSCCMGQMSKGLLIHSRCSTNASNSEVQEVQDSWQFP